GKAVRVILASSYRHSDTQAKAIYRAERVERFCGQVNSRGLRWVVMFTSAHWVVWLLAAITWLTLHSAHFPARRLFLVHITRSGAKSRLLRQAWRVLQVVQKVLLVGCYGLVAAGLMVGKPGQAMWMLGVAITIAGACPDHWRRTGTIPYSYFEVVVIVACCSGVYMAAVQLPAKQNTQIVSRAHAEDSALLGSFPLVCLVHYVLVLRTRRTHMTLTATASLGALTQLLAEERQRLEKRLDSAFESFHAVCNMNRIEASLERVGTCWGTASVGLSCSQ
ncbi:hypothetical protein GOP47_0020315, partial [Adiantum capillus-veneris]